MPMHLVTDTETPNQRAARQVLAEIALVSEGTTAKLDGKTAGGKPGTKDPPGAWDKEPTLLGFWTQRFHDHWERERSLGVQVELARDALARRRGRAPIPVDEDGGREDTLERDARCLEWYDGVHFVRAAALESQMGGYCSPESMRRLRIRNDRDPTDGTVRPPAEFRQQVALRLQAEGYSERRIAEELGVPRSTVRRLLGRGSVDRRAA